MQIKSNGYGVFLERKRDVCIFIDSKTTNKSESKAPLN
jgi:hypothetical protein